MKTGLKFLWVSLIVIIIDLWSKYIVVQHFEFGESINILPIFNFTYARNYGAAFSFLADHSGWQKYFFLGLAVVISSALVVALWKNQAVK
ncbi:TPA: signal peptidase II, partial [Mannheimia haemolytica]|nr:signal peptidase II [Mannheimia haemolytica]